MKSTKSMVMSATLGLLVGAGCGAEGVIGPAGGEELMPETQAPAGSVLVEVDPNRRALTPPTGDPSQLATGTYTDSTGRVQMQIWECVSGLANWIDVACSVGDPSYVVVGGGASVDSGGPGALLTASYPGDSGLTFWRALSKDHLQSSRHSLRVYVIGMKLAGVSKSTLLSNMELRQSTSSAAPWPQSETFVSAGWSLIGGGARVGGEGVVGVNNLLFKSKPSACGTTPVWAPDGTRTSKWVCNSWAAQSKDHGTASPQSITTFAIGINPDIPNFGRLAFTYWMFPGDWWVSSGVVTQGVNENQDPAVTCVGAESWFSGSGRLLFKMSPATPTTNFGWEARSKDHAYTSGGSVDLHLIGVRG